MTEYNKSQIFKKAWNMVKHNGMTMSEALKLFWKRAKRLVESIRASRAKEEKSFSIKEWFYNKNSEKFRFRNGSASRWFEESDIVKETEKAYNVTLEVESYDGEHTLFITKVWVPKSCVEAA